MLRPTWLIITPAACKQPEQRAAHPNQAASLANSMVSGEPIQKNTLALQSGIGGRGGKRVGQMLSVWTLPPAASPLSGSFSTVVFSGGGRKTRPAHAAVQHQQAGGRLSGLSGPSPGVGVVVGQEGVHLLTKNTKYDQNQSK